MQGGCSCGATRYSVQDKPMFVHCCHCTWCQRETGSAFATNALFETTKIEVLFGRPEGVPTPSSSGRGQTIVRCTSCRVALWSHYHGAGPQIAFLRVGTLDHPHEINPDVHIFTSTRRPWVALPENVPAFEAYYDMKDVWPADSLARRTSLSG